MGGLECVITGLMDEFSGFFKNRKWPRERFTFAVIGISFCVALINVTPVNCYDYHIIILIQNVYYVLHGRYFILACVFNLGWHLYASFVGHVCCWYISAVFGVI